MLRDAAHASVVKVSLFCIFLFVLFFRLGAKSTSAYFHRTGYSCSEIQLSALVAQLQNCLSSVILFLSVFHVCESINSESCFSHCFFNHFFVAALFFANFKKKGGNLNILKQELECCIASSCNDKGNIAWFNVVCNNVQSIFIVQWSKIISIAINLLYSKKWQWHGMQLHLMKFSSFSRT